MHRYVSCSCPFLNENSKRQLPKSSVSLVKNRINLVDFCPPWWNFVKNLVDFQASPGLLQRGVYKSFHTVIFVSDVTLLRCYAVTMLCCYDVTLLRCYAVTMLRCCDVTLLWCYAVTMLCCYDVTLLRCLYESFYTVIFVFAVTMLRCYHVTMFV